MRRLLAAAALAALALTACGFPFGEFKISGEITVASPLVPELPRENSVLFVVVKSPGGMPVAVHRIVNPQFPVPYEVGRDDVLVPGYRPKGPFRVYVEMNTHGNVGKPSRGDFSGEASDPVSTRQTRVHIVIDRRL